MLLLIAALTAHASAPMPEQMVMRGQHVALAGLILTPLGVGGANVPGLTVPGLVLGFAGPPMLAGGTMRAAHGLRDLGLRHSYAGSTLCWTFWVAAQVSSLALYPDHTVPTVLFGASYLAGTSQFVANGIAARQALWRPEAQARADLQLVPVRTRALTGVALVGSF